MIKPAQQVSATILQIATRYNHYDNRPGHL